MKIPLFDIDGTLFKAQNLVHFDALDYTFWKVYEVPAKISEINPEGNTEIKTILTVMKLHGLTPEKIRLQLKKAIETEVKYFKQRKNELGLKILPGVRELLTKLKKKSIPIGVLSGNAEGVGWTKIEQAGLRDFFDFGAFGDKAEIRADLVKIARKNAEKALGRTFQIQDFIIVGDTPKDIQCARDAKIGVIAVATGIYSYKDLEKEKPDLMVHTLEDKKVFDFITT